MLRVFILLCGLGQPDCDESTAVDRIVLPERVIMCPMPAPQALLASTELRDALAEGQRARIICKRVQQG
jgi:hypothetical protein